MLPLDLILDVEATCWEGESWRERGSEVIEIGAVAADGAAEAFWIRPVHEPILSEFCTRLTSITQAMVDGAPLFLETLAAFVAWVETHAGKPVGDVRWGSWGFYDLNILVANCATHGVPLPLRPEHHVNVKLEVLPLLGLKKGTVADALVALGIPFEGTHHRGIDDARMIRRIRDEARRRDPPRA
jgi:3'-5' exoribonuclease 1